MSGQSEVSTGKMGLIACVMLLVGAMIGSAIFSLSGLTILMAGPAAMLSWLIGGLIMLVYGLFTAELADRYPKSGGGYYFPRMAFKGKVGLYLGWISCWCSILTNLVAIAFSAIYVGLYLSVAFPWAKGLQIPLALGSILVCLGINLLNVKLAGKINALIVSVLLLTIAAYIVSAFCGGTYSTEMLTPFFFQGTGKAAGFLAAVPTAIIGYSGIVALSYLVSQVDNAHRTVPLAMIISVGTVITIYLLVILATVGLVSSQYLVENPGMQFIPLFAACFTKLSAFPWLTGVVSISAVLALMTTMLVCVSMNAWAIQAASRDGVLPEKLGRLNSNGLPAIAAIVTCLLSMIYSCFPNLTQQIVNFGAVFNIITMVLTMLALIKSRKDACAGQFRAWGGAAAPYVVLAILLACNVVGILNGGMSLWLYTLAFLALGCCICLLCKKH